MNEHLHHQIAVRGFRSDLAQIEGWDIFDCGDYPSDWSEANAQGKPRVEIQQLDDGDTFLMDEDAIRHVMQRACEGSPNHVAALQVIQDCDRFSFAWVMHVAGRDVPDLLARRRQRIEDSWEHFWRTMLALLLILTSTGLMAGMGAAWAVVGWEHMDGSPVTIIGLGIVAWLAALRLTMLNHIPDAPWSSMLPRWITRMWSQ